MDESADDRPSKGIREVNAAPEPDPETFRIDEQDPSGGWSEVARQIWLAGLGVMVTTGEEGARLFHELVERGRQAEPELNENWNRVRAEVVRRVQSLPRPPLRLVSSGPETEERLRERLQQLGVPSREEIADLTRRMEEISTQIEAILHAGKGHHERD